MANIPNTTQTPNIIFNGLMKEMSDTELRVVLIVTRATLGWIMDRERGMRKEEDWISHYQLKQKTIAPLPDNIEIPMTLKEFVDWCGKSKQKYIRIIGNWADTVEPDFKTKQQWEVFIKRNLRPAKNLEPFEDKRLIEGFKKIQEAAKQGWLKKYTLETLFKFIRPTAQLLS